jgi:cation diffusion facilitator CzcD-associated flavoprotein CzcO
MHMPIASLIVKDSYIFYFNPNPDWSQCYAKGPEIQQYILDTAERYGLRERIQFKTKVISSIWNDKEGKWDLRLQRGKEVFEDKADVLINGSGVLKYGPQFIGLLG